jgi:DnaK suppressor protein
VKKSTGKQKKIVPATPSGKKPAGKAMKKSIKTAAVPKKAAKSAGTRKPEASGTAARRPKASVKTIAKTIGRKTSSPPSRPSRPVKAPVKAAKTIAPTKTSAVKPKATEKKHLSPRERMFLEIRKKLLQQKFDLLSEAEEALNALPGQTIFPDLGDQASAEIDRNFMLRLRGREQRLLKKIEEAIEKIDTGAFGVCDVCGQEIDIKRLDARPVTNMCILCKTEQEEEEKARGV